MSDPELEIEDDDAAAMAAAMGFSSFGSAPAKKKRKFNAQTDAFVEGQALEGIDRGGKKGKGSGGNTVALGKQRVLGVPANREEEGQEKGNEQRVRVDGVVEWTTQNDAEIELDEGGSGSEDERPNYMDTSEAAPVEQEQRKLEIRGGQKDDEVQDRIDAILGNTQPPPGAEGNHSLPARAPPGIDQGTYTSRGRGHGGRGGRGGHHGGGERNDKWWEDYYDTTFNMNPWGKLEKDLGLPSVGSWLEQGHWTFER